MANRKLKSELHLSSLGENCLYFTKINQLIATTIMAIAHFIITFCARVET